MSETLLPSDYEAQVKRTLNNDTPLAVLALGIAGEAGEVAELIKKYLGHGHTLYRNELLKELGDVLWYITAVAMSQGSTLDEVMRINVDKLRKRYPDGFKPVATI